MKFSKRFLNDILYCGLSKEAYEEIKPLIVQRNRYMLKFTSKIMTSLGALLLVIQFVIGRGYSQACFPYLFMTVGGGLAIFARKFLRWNKEKHTMLFCYIDQTIPYNDFFESKWVVLAELIHNTYDAACLPNNTLQAGTA